MRTFFLVIFFLSFVPSAATAQEEDYNLWISWDLLEKTTFVAGALSQAPMLCEAIADYQKRIHQNIEYTSLYYECITRKNAQSMNVVAVTKEMDIIYSKREMRNLALPNVYREAIYNIRNKPKK